jgi:K+-transporting ATPase A subunit
MTPNRVKFCAGGLTYFPALAHGPLAEHFAILNGLSY